MPKLTTEERFKEELRKAHLVAGLAQATPSTDVTSARVKPAESPKKKSVKSPQVVSSPMVVESFEVNDEMPASSEDAVVEEVALVVEMTEDTPSEF